MANKGNEHPLESKRSLAGLAIIVFWGAGVTMIDQHPAIGIALCAITVAGTIWLYSEDFKKMQLLRVKKWPWIGLFLIAIGIVVPGYQLSVKAKDASSPFVVAQNNPSSVTGNCNVQGNNNSGNNLNCGTINQAPPPDFRQLQLPAGQQAVQKNPDGTYTLRALYEVVAPYPPGQMYLEVTAPWIIGIDAVPQRVGGMMTGPTGINNQTAFITIMNPFGQYMVQVRTREIAKVQFEYRFQ